MGSSCVAGNGERAQAVARNGDMVCMEQEKGEVEDLQYCREVARKSKQSGRTIEVTNEQTKASNFW